MVPAHEVLQNAHCGFHLGANIAHGIGQVNLFSAPKKSLPERSAAKEQADVG